MVTEGEFVFKSIEERQGGTFTNEQGKEIAYDSVYVLKVDEISEKGINERKFKIPLKLKNLITDLKELKPYDKIILEFDIDISGNYPKLNVVDFRQE